MAGGFVKTLQCVPEVTLHLKGNRFLFSHNEVWATGIYYKYLVQVSSKSVPEALEFLCSIINWVTFDI